MTTRQIAVRLDPDLLARLDELVASGAYKSRAEVVRVGVTKMILEQVRSEEIDRAYIEGYTKFPVTEAELRCAEITMRASIEEEPW